MKESNTCSLYNEYAYGEWERVITFADVKIFNYISLSSRFHLLHANFKSLSKLISRKKFYRAHPLKVRKLSQ